MATRCIVSANDAWKEYKHNQVWKPEEFINIHWFSHKQAGGNVEAQELPLDAMESGGVQRLIGKLIDDQMIRVLLLIIHLSFVDRVELKMVPNPRPLSTVNVLRFQSPSMKADSLCFSK